MTTTKHKATGKKQLPYLLSTTATLTRCKRYYYDLWDFKFNCHRHRDYYSVDNAAKNLNRVWHNIIIPNAMLCRESGNPATWTDAMEAVKYAMTVGKTARAVEAYRNYILAERDVPECDRAYTKMKAGWAYYALAVDKVSGKPLPKSKHMELRKYLDKLDSRFLELGKGLKTWRSPWHALNRVLVAYDASDDREWLSNLTVRKISDEFKCSTRVANMAKIWFRDWIKANDFDPTSCVGYSYLYDKPEPEPEPEPAKELPSSLDFLTIG